MTIEELDRFLSDREIDFEIIHHEKPIKSRFDALKYFRLEDTAPTLILKSEKGMYALVVCGGREKVDLEMIRKSINCTEINLAEKSEVIEVLGMKPGAIALVGHNLPCILDNRLFNSEYIFGGAGDFNYTLKINPRDLEKINQVVFTFD